MVFVLSSSIVISGQSPTNSESKYPLAIESSSPAFRAFFCFARSRKYKSFESQNSFTSRFSHKYIYVYIGVSRNCLQSHKSSLRENRPLESDSSSMPGQTPLPRELLGRRVPGRMIKKIVRTFSRK